MECANKRGYLKISDAQRVAQQRRKSGVPYLRVYQCRRCGRYHLTKKRGTL